MLVEADRQEYWASLLDRLSELIGLEEEAAIRQAAVDRGSPSHVRHLHNLVAGLLVKHGLTTWSLLHATFPEYYNGVNGEGARALQGGLPTSSRPEVVDAAALAEDAAHISRVQDRAGQGDAAFNDHIARRDALGQKQPAKFTQKHTQEESAKQLKRKADGSIAGAVDQNQLRSQGASIKGPSGSGSKGGTLADFPRIVQWWHPTKNGAMLPGDCARGSSKRAWLQCPGCQTCGEVHQWDTVANDLARRGDLKCPSCTHKGGSVSSFCSCQAISADERLRLEWHEDNPSPSTVHRGSGKRYKWRCADAACGHVWETKPSSRSGTGGSNCPKCANVSRKETKHPSVAVGRPELLAEWDKEKNTCLATDVTLGSMRKVWWLCSKCGNSWEARVNVRAIKGRGCPKRCHLPR